MSKLMTLLEYVLLSVVVSYWIYTKFENYFRSVYLALSMGGPKPVPILGNVFILKDHISMIRIAKNAANYGPIFRTWILHLPLFFVHEPDHLKDILSGSKVSSDKNFLYSLAETFIGKGLITNNGYSWKKNRQAIQPFFHIKILENYLSIFSECAQYVVNNLPQDKYTNVVELVNVTILKSLHKAVLGINLENPTVTPFRSGELLAIQRLVKPWLLSDFWFKQSKMSTEENAQRQTLKKYIKEAINHRREITRNNKIKLENCCLLDMMLEASEDNENFTEDDIINEAVTFVLAGQDSVAAALALCIFYMAKSPDIQEKAYSEISGIITDDNDLTCIKLDHLNRMQYLEQCVKETLRLAPSVPMVFRVLREDTHLGKDTLPAGSNICISPFITHRLPHIFPEPEKFDPDRFSSENLRKMHPYAFIPFSAGPRNCIGAKFAILELKTILATILQKFDISLKPGTEEAVFAYRIALRAKGGVWIKAVARDKSSRRKFVS